MFFRRALASFCSPNPQAQQRSAHGSGEHGKRRYEARAESWGQPRGLDVERGEHEQRDGALLVRVRVRVRVGVGLGFGLGLAMARSWGERAASRRRSVVAMSSPAAAARTPRSTWLGLG